jgi:23S rRNA (adenine2503-C2)-methyltransferase
VKPALALSLHSTKPALRAEAAAARPAHRPRRAGRRRRAYARATGHPIQYQWTLLDGVNDGDDEVEGIATLLAGRHAMMNFIPFNAGPGSTSAALVGARRGDGAAARAARHPDAAAAFGRAGCGRRLRAAPGAQRDRLIG